eukprot:symbB.v1.2.017416.t1/scaffold1359.1/size123592/1
MSEGYSQRRSWYEPREYTKEELDSLSRYVSGLLRCPKRCKSKKLYRTEDGYAKVDDVLHILANEYHFRTYQENITDFFRSMLRNSIYDHEGTPRFEEENFGRERPGDGAQSSKWPGNFPGNVRDAFRMKLSQRFSLPDATRHVSLLTRILEWKFNTQTFEQDFNAWETVKAKYEQQTGTPIPDSVLVATLMNKTSGALQQHLRLNAATINTYDQMRNTLVQYFRSRHILTSSDSGLAPMDIGALKGKGYFKGKNKGKGKGFSHWNFMKGKGGKSKGKGKGKNFKGMKGKGKGKTSNKGKGKGVVCYTCGKPGHTSRE